MRLVLFAVVAVLSIAAAAFLPSDVGLHVVTKSGYWVVTLVVAIWLTYASAFAARHREAIVRLLVDNRIALGMVAIAALYVCTREPYGFKITMDEVVMGGTALNMHVNREPTVFGVGHELFGVFENFGSYLDKRPLLFPWIVSVVHDLTGYRVANVHIVNTLLTVALLWLVFLTARTLKGFKAGALALLLLATFPLLAQNAAGAGFEILNLVLLLLCLILGIRFLRQPDVISQGIFVLTCVLLAHTRYESILYVFATGAIVIADWILRRRILISGALIVAPIALLQIPWHLKTFAENPHFWQLPENLKRPFGPEFLPDNLGHFLNYAVTAGAGTSNSIVLSALSLLALPLVLVHLGGKLSKEWKANPHFLTLLIFLGIALANLTVLLSYHWGQVDKFEVTRLALPIYIFGAICAPFVLLRISERREVVFGCVLAIVASAVAFTIPDSSRHRYTAANYYVKRMDWMLEFHKSLPPARYLFITHYSIFASLHRISAVPGDRATERVRQVHHHLVNGTFREVYAFQVVRRDPETRVETIEPGWEISPAYKLETVKEAVFWPYELIRVSRVVSIDPEYVAAAPVDAGKASDAAVPKEEQQQELKRDSDRVRRWGEMLP